MERSESRTTYSHYASPYYLFNVALILLYVILRLFRLDPGELSRPDPIGFSRESHVYFCLVLMLFVRTLSAPTLTSYISHAFNFTRIAILFLLYLMNKPLCMIFTILWTIIYVLFPQPLPHSPPHIKALNPVTLKAHVLDNKFDTAFHFVYCHTTWATKCVHLAPIYIKLSNKYRHVRFHWAKIDLGRYAAMAKEVDVSLAITGRSLPTLLCYKGGNEIARVEGGGRGSWRVGELAEALRLDHKMELADKWEKDAKRRFAKETKRKKGK